MEGFFDKDPKLKEISEEVQKHQDNGEFSLLLVKSSNTLLDF